MNLLSGLRTAAFAATDVIASKSLNFNISQNSVEITNYFDSGLKFPGGDDFSI